MSIGIADIFASVRLNLDTGKFEADALKSTDIIAGKMGSKLKAAAGGALGAGLGLAFASATKGALELDAAMSKLQADTGMTADEAKAAQTAMAGLFKDNLQSFEQIGAAMSKVYTDLGLTGEAATQATAEILKFSTATGIDAAQAVTLLDDALDNWGLTAADSQMVMDKVIVSHQKWGGSIDKNLVTLAKVAPAMIAANFSIDDGIALLGLFGAKGLDSERAAAAFAKALTKVKSPEELQALITDISNTADPFERAQKAAELFGAKAGAQLANALGGTSLDDYKVGMEEAADATVAAGDAIEDSIGNRAVMAFKELNGALADFGTGLGDLLIVAAMLGPTLTKGIALAGGALVGALGGGAVIAAAAVPAAIIAAVAAMPVLMFHVIPSLMGSKDGNELAAGQALGLSDSATQTMVSVGLGNLLAKAAADQAVVQAATHTGATVAQTFVDGYTSVLAPGVTAASADAGASAGTAASWGFSDAAMATMDTVRAAGVLTVEEWASGANVASDTIVSTGKQLMAAFQHPLNVARLKTKLAGALHSKALVDGLHAGNPAVRGAAHDQAIAILTYLDALKGPVYIAGRNAAIKLADGLRSAMAASMGGPNSPFRNMIPSAAKQIGAIEALFPSYESQIEKLKPGSGTIQGNKDLADVISMLGGKIESTGDKASSAADKAKEKAKKLADEYKEKLTAAIDKAKESANKFFDDLHDANVKAINDTRDLANAQLDAQIGGINAEVQAARDALKATRDARRQAELQDAVTNATTDEQRASAQTALDDWLADQRIDQMEKDAKAKIGVLETEKKANDDLAAEQIKAEDERAKAQQAAWDKEIKALETQLAKHPVAWKAANDAVLKLLADNGVSYQAAGAGIGAAFASGMAAGLAGAKLAGVPTLYAAPGASGSAASTMPMVAGGVGGVNVGTINISGASGDPKVLVQDFMAELQRERLRQNMSFG